ncbi:hypothetical protein CARUB_v10027964mg [Capsella rubella]|uniref:Uncharacterized protein n=1 Tax=Capsella rubella TaxID=81985 RepID=R0F0A9_9BRAS|nr:hypothetical protein CARUB_v10027964mg [Capsella rubella]
MTSSTATLLGPPSVATVKRLKTTTFKPLTSVSDDHIPRKGLSENFSPTLLSSGNPCLNFFFHVVSDTSTEKLIQRLASSWSQDPLTTLKLVSNLRGVRRTGELFYTAAFWLYKNHPKTLALNLPALVDFCYFRDLPEILYRILEGQQMDRGKIRVWRKTGPVDKVKARALRKHREFEKAKKALRRYNSDANYRLLFDGIAALFADFLKSDLKYLNSNELIRLPRRMFSRDEYEGVGEAHYAYRIRDRLRKEVLVPLHKALELSAVSISEKGCDLLKYKRVASVEHDREKIAAGALLPHQIIEHLKDSEFDAEVAELQWTRVVDDFGKKGKLKNSLAACDVSKSMAGTPMEVCVALGLLVSEVNDEPWKGKVITLTKSPQLHIIKGSSLMKKTEFIREMKCVAHPEFPKVIDRILKFAVKNNLTNDQMIKRLFVFSDMEFYDAAANSHLNQQEAKEKWETDYQKIQRKYRKMGLENVPELVFWNLRDSSATPVMAKQKGVAMVSGFSKNLLTLFLEKLEKGGLINPEDVMMLAIKGEKYEKLAVYD